MIPNFLNSEAIHKLHHAFEEGESILIEELWNSPKAFVAALEAPPRKIAALEQLMREPSVFERSGELP